MAFKRMSVNEAVFYVILKQCKILSDDETPVELTISDVQLDHRLNRVRLKYSDGSGQIVGLDTKIDIDVDGVSLEPLHDGQETPIQCTRPRKKNKGRK